ncbi:MAG: matrixin family metalloprotease [Phycisphaerales bacterium]|nr:matrixin family metalloprotease [Phycisphaerales bacterium]
MTRLLARAAECERTGATKAIGAASSSTTRRRRIVLTACGLVTLLPLVACVPPTESAPVGDVEDGNRGEIPADTTGKTQGEPNGSFDASILAVIDDAGEAALEGTITSGADVDVFNLGAIDPGDQILISADTPGSSLDIAISLFDDEGRLIFYNDDKSGSDFDAEIDHIARHAGTDCYLLVEASSFHSAGAGSGTYQVDVSLWRGGDVPEPVAQTLFLDFNGGAVDSPTLGRVTISPFDAAEINADYEGETESLKELIRVEIEANFAAFDVQVVTSDAFTPGPADKQSTLFFGGYQADIFGEAEDVDLYNLNCCDDAIIYTQSFDPDVVFFRPPTTAQMGRAIGNVASHEAGHLLGLNHTNDDTDLMDEQSAAQALTRDQEFIEAPLSTQIAPIGTQDSALLLLETLGPAT